MGWVNYFTKIPTILGKVAIFAIDNIKD